MLKFLGNVIFNIKQLISRKLTFSMKVCASVENSSWLQVLSWASRGAPCSDQGEPCAHY